MSALILKLTLDLAKVVGAGELQPGATLYAGEEDVTRSIKKEARSMPVDNLGGRLLRAAAIAVSTVIDELVTLRAKYSVTVRGAVELRMENSRAVSVRLPLRIHAETHGALRESKDWDCSVSTTLRSVPGDPTAAAAVDRATFNWECDPNIHPLGIKINVRDLVEKVAKIDEKLNNVHGRIQAAVTDAVEKQRKELVGDGAGAKIDFWFESLDTIAVSVQ